MSQIFIPAFDNENRPVFAGNKPVDRIYFNLIKLGAAEVYQYRLHLMDLIPGIAAMREKFK
jgi:hypothetical protein